MRTHLCAALGVLLIVRTVALAQVQPEEPLTKVPTPIADQAPVLPEGAEPVGPTAASQGDSCNYCPECADPCRGAWLQADYLLWWVRSGPTGGPLLTTGSPSDDGTKVLFGGHPFDFNTFNGMRLSGGYDLNPWFGVEGSGFLLESRSVGLLAASDANGSPAIGRPVINNQTGTQGIVFTSSPGQFSGSSAISSHTCLSGYELNLAGHLNFTPCSTLDLLIGFRGLSLNEDLIAQDQLTPFTADTLTFLGAAVEPPSTLSDFDRFHCVNQFYGGQMGARWQQLFGQFSLEVIGKLALGSTQETVTIDGATTLHTPGQAPITAPGGVLAQSSNSGMFSRSVFSAVPEVDVNMGWQLTRHLKATMGYTFIYWNNVARPGDQIDFNINPALAPSSPDFGSGLGQDRPAFQFRSSDFWAQGVSFGFEVRY